jgi:hypothetical protein
MNNNKNIEVVNYESFSLYTLLQYINENIYGLILLVLVFFIIYFVDYISRINYLIFAIPPSIPGMIMTTNTSIINPSKGKFKKFKKR